MPERHFGVGLQIEKLVCLRRVLQRKAAETTLLHRGQLPVLEYIRGNPGCTQVQIAEALLVSPSSVAQSTKRMQRDGLLKKQTEEDQRCNRLYLTQHGEAVSETCRKRFVETDAEVFSVLSEEERETFTRLMGKLIGNAAQLAGIDVEQMDFESLMQFKHRMHADKLGEKKRC